jgi:hypothetical protein
VTSDGAPRRSATAEGYAALPHGPAHRPPPAHDVPRAVYSALVSPSRLDRRIREPKDLEAIYGLPLLGAGRTLDRIRRPRSRLGGQHCFC